MAFWLLVAPPLVVFLCSKVFFEFSFAVSISISLISCFAFCDLWYFLRFVFGSVRWWIEDFFPQNASKPQRKLFEKSILQGRVLLNDIDRNGHCNNARFLRECGFGRRDLWHVSLSDTDISVNSILGSCSFLLNSLL
jgi:hypothetical protein